MLLDDNEASRRQQLLLGAHVPKTPWRGAKEEKGHIAAVQEGDGDEDEARW